MPFVVRHAKTRKDSANERVFHAQNRLTGLFEGEVKLASLAVFAVRKRTRSKDEREDTSSHATREKISVDTNEKWWSRQRLTKRVCQCSFFNGSLDRPIFQIGSQASGLANCWAKTDELIAMFFRGHIYTYIRSQNQLRRRDEMQWKQNRSTSLLLRWKRAKR